MKKTYVCVATVVALGAFGTWAGLVNAQQPGGIKPVSATAPAPSPVQGTRVAVLNINSVLKGYNKAQGLNTAIRNKVQVFADKMNALRTEVNKMQAEMTQPTCTAARREQCEKSIVTLNRNLQDLDAEARKVITAEQTAITSTIFGEIESVVNAVATTNNFDLVLSYPDGTTPTEMTSQENIVRKLAAQAAIPMYFKPQIDITNAVVQTLNARYPVAAAPAAGGAAMPPK